MICMNIIDVNSIKLINHIHFFSLLSDRDAAQLLIYREANSNAIKIASFKFSRNGWFLFLTKEGKFRGGVPSNGSEVFEEVVLNPIANIVALRVRNYARIVHLESSDSSNSAPVMPGRNGPECYLGFSDKTKRAYCYSNKDSANVRLQILPKLI